MRMWVKDNRKEINRMCKIENSSRFENPTSFSKKKTVVSKCSHLQCIKLQSGQYFKDSDGLLYLKTHPRQLLNLPMQLGSPHTA